MALALQLSIVRDRVERIATTLTIPNDRAFLRLVYSLTTGRAPDELEPDEITDGAGDRQIDVIIIDDASAQDSATVYVIQASYSDSLSTNYLRLMGTGLEWLFERPRDEYGKIQNKALADKIADFRELRTDQGPANIRIQCCFATLADSSKLSVEFRQELDRIRSRFQNAAGEFSFEILGAAELVALMEQGDTAANPVNERIQIDYDLNRGSLLEHSIQGIDGVVCTVPAKEVARLVQAHSQIFDRNLRRFRGTQTRVNCDIRETSTTDEAGLFWFLNNGVTVICDSYQINRDKDNPYVAVDNMQIVNGCQTSATLAQCSDDGTLKLETKVLMRVFKAESADLAERVVITTNNQTRISSRDLNANHPIQRTLQRAFENILGLLYERKPFEFAKRSSADQAKVVSNEKIGQAVLAIVLKRPSDARRRKYKVWGDDYSRVFTELRDPAVYLLSLRIAEYCEQRKRELYKALPEAGLRRRILVNGVYHVARAIAHVWRHGDDWNDLEVVKKQIRELAESSKVLERLFEQAVNVVEGAVKGNDEFASDFSSALKSGRLDQEIDRELYRRAS